MRKASCSSTAAAMVEAISEMWPMVLPISLKGEGTVKSHIVRYACVKWIVATRKLHWFPRSIRVRAPASGAKMFAIDK